MKKNFFLFSAIILLFPFFSFAFYFENFDKYDSGIWMRDINPEHWEGDGKVSNRTSFSLPNSLEIGAQGFGWNRSSFKNAFEFSPSNKGGIIKLKWKTLASYDRYSWFYLYNNDINDYVAGFSIEQSGFATIRTRTNGEVASFNFSPQEWNDVTIEFKIQNNKLYFRYKVNDQISNWYTNNTTDNRYHKVNRLDFMQLVSPNFPNDRSYIDDLYIQGENEKVISENCLNTGSYLDNNFYFDIFDTIRQFNPPYPNKAYYVVPTSTSIFFKATAINSSFVILYKPEKIILKSRKTGSTTEISISGNWLPQGSFNFNQNITNELLNAFSGEDDAVEMRILIKRKNILTTGLVADNLYFPLECAPQIILVQNPNSPYLFTEIPSESHPPDYLIPLQDCSNPDLNFLEKTICEIRNFLITIFIPKKSTLDELIARKDLLAQKFPFNVFTSFKNFFFDVYYSLKDPKVEITMFNKKIIVNPQTYQQMPVISGLYSAIRIFFDIILIFLAIKVLRFEINSLLKAI
jgi:hypothetical protein